MRRPALVLAALLLLAGCGGTPAPAGQPEPGTTAPRTTSATATGGSSSPAPAAAVPEKLQFTAMTVDGKDFRGESLAGKPAVLWFWAPWCPKCRREASGLAEVAKRHEGKVTFVGVAAQDRVEAMRDFVQKRGVGGFTHLADTEAALWKRFGVTYQPAYAFLSADGTIETETKQLGKDALAARVAGLAG
ncbi:Thiol-disulfide isomerase or thioredoxin [Actinokineospora alba]|uniref:Thiol-disulfide isomerase or thioredoxin n=1 Tax=Actinokineospora alba TaxID=504798 RepID=A0A1H0K964_9PSEU|nr:redoxin domain-containing protein [Actinokineospora alba]TDP67994.1 thiol-disulfide isomerase/thioredoxin [Actinokineospora alba]SDH90368.1 Thiol-disulfide isomerase or thioredoxin [Actinokineospora alba]SDO52447.1 Thiol-disulfide isomerase or thioredoxin [Actinokineospora alba]